MSRMHHILLTICHISGKWTDVNVMLALLSVDSSSHHCLLSWGYTAARWWLVWISWLSPWYHSVYLLHFAVNKSQQRQQQQQRCGAHLQAKANQMNRGWEKETARGVDWCEALTENKRVRVNDGGSISAGTVRQAGWKWCNSCFGHKLHQQVPGESCRSFTPAERTHRSCWVWCRR